MSPWDSAKTHNDMIPLNIAWLKGELLVHPQWGLTAKGTTIMDETIPIVDDLIRLNRLGYLTVCSQPNDDDQLAMVIGFVTLNKLLQIHSGIMKLNDIIDFSMCLSVFNNVPVVRIDCNAKSTWADRQEFWNVLTELFGGLVVQHNTMNNQ